MQWNNEGQPIGDSGALLNMFLGSISRNFNAFPISYSSWRKIPKDYKEDILKNTIQVKFDVHSDVHVNHVLKSLNTKWRDYRQELWQQRNDGTRTREELIAMAPKGIDRDQSASFDHALKNIENRAKQTIAHTGGSKSIARKKNDEMEKECGHKVSRGEVWIATHKCVNETFVSDEAREINEKIQAYESKLSSSQSKDISINDSLAHAFGSQEHYGRVRGLGLGPCPSKVFGFNAHSCNGTSSSFPSYTQLQNQVSNQGSVPNEETNDSDQDQDQD
ncbi:uncharacterized protein LOC114194945 [Vigna unguiculata]|uniref:uncharacterized protein LOC114194945 n=1 Tax=Vigna unguiculata TaxID=3917 RepID=UPI0010170991|nr:uncharacterized protein LOC114194945 [Vigna unguiculata]